MIDKKQYFHRQIQLWGDDIQEALADKKIAIIGAGGLGSSLALALGTSGIGEINIVDFDRVALHNIHRQIAFTLKDENSYKSQRVAKLVLSKNRFVKVNAFVMDFTSFANLGKKYDLILDATDNFETRKEIDKYSQETKTPWIYASVEAWHGYVCFFENGSFEAFDTKAHTPDGIAAPIVMQVASLEANIALRYLAGLSVKRDKLYYLFYDKDGEFMMQKFRL
ncbi:MAG TPA: ThiF family adenylyltransferase [Epsilonproteobacteria bacterium]|nr:ThiF family adenylyltransferase [Campylobacterota bacterium]